jgi:hypothetical protein
MMVLELKDQLHSTTAQYEEIYNEDVSERPYHSP